MKTASFAHKILIIFVGLAILFMMSRIDKVEQKYGVGKMK